MSWLTPLLHQDQSELLEGGEVGPDKLCEAASPWPVPGILVLSWEPMKDYLAAPYFF